MVTWASILVLLLISIETARPTVAGVGVVIGIVVAPITGCGAGEDGNGRNDLGVNVLNYHDNLKKIVLCYPLEWG